MKRKNFKIYIPIGIAVMGLVFACNKSFLEKAPVGSYTPDVIATKAGVSGLLIGAYSLLDGEGGAGPNTPGPWATAGSNWVFGSVCADDSHKGSDPGDQPDIVSLMTWSETSTNSYNEGVWQARYDGVQRSNEVLREMRLAKDIAPPDTIQLSAEARFLRAFYMMELKKIFGNVPWVDESVTYTAGNWRVPNDVDVATNDANVWPKIEADLSYAVANLPATQSQVGRINKWGAQAYLAKAYMFEHKYASALPLLTDLMANGVTSGGLKYKLVDNFNDNFNAATKNNSESVFAAQNSVNDGSTAANANAGDVLNFSYDPAMPVSCCGFNQPSYSLANAYKTDPVTGYPLPDTYNNSNLKNDEGLKSSDPFTPDVTTPLDPRIDWTIGRRGIPFLDWGINPGFIFVRNQASGGPYAPVKNAPYASQVGALTDKSSWTAGYTALNINLCRFADVILWAAECEVEVGSLDNAQADVNIVRLRAKNTPTPAGSPALYAGTQGSNVANLPFVYAAGFFSGLGQAGARKYVQFERRLELAMEGQRFFDLVRYGTAATELNAYVAKEVGYGYSLLSGATFKDGQSNYFAIPQQEIDASTVGGKPTLTQNPGY
ncbi:MAG TPA: RagB/SusD family nutrient uptake outer membrane protein [Chitinophagaceae bacterium]|jgi:starch-binding outer membrane protein, SusD/RagB family|nr:RagB/SusD family nutrient uptake outer membrane protein [Chitinophagaceae bacterium]